MRAVSIHSKRAFYTVGVFRQLFERKNYRLKKLFGEKIVDTFRGKWETFSTSFVDGTTRMGVCTR